MQVTFYEMLFEAYEGETMKKSGVSDWYKRFKEGREYVEDDERSGHPRSHITAENVEGLRNLVHSDRRLSTNIKQA
jgi:hypothetical protein